MSDSCVNLPYQGERGAETPLVGRYECCQLSLEFAAAVVECAQNSSVERSFYLRSLILARRKTSKRSLTGDSLTWHKIQDWSGSDWSEEQIRRPTIFILMMEQKLLGPSASVIAHTACRKTQSSMDCNMCVRRHRAKFHIFVKLQVLLSLYYLYLLGDTSRQVVSIEKSHASATAPRI